MMKGGMATKVGAWVSIVFAIFTTINYAFENLLSSYAVTQLKM
jgi:hypothetical protein